MHNWILKTDLSGAQWWEKNETTEPCSSTEHIFDKAIKANAGDYVFRTQKTGINFQPQGSSVLEKGWSYYSQLQEESGHWPGDYGGPMFLLPGLIIAAYVTDSPFGDDYAREMKQYMLQHQNSDGGWGLHLQGGSTMFGTVLQYVALRLLGEGKESPQLTQARRWIKQNGGATQIPSWGKFYLSVLGVYEWEGNNSLLPEMWLLPKWLPMHPSRYWCHARMVYLPMAYCYSKKVTGPITPLVKELRSEIYIHPYAQINWKEARNACAEVDIYYPQSSLLKFLNVLLNAYEKFSYKAWRTKAENFMLSYINVEDEQTNYINIGPVNQVINSICVWHAYGVHSIPFKKHRERWREYLWVSEDGMKMQGYNGAQFWDTAFATQALLESNLKEQFDTTLKKSYRFIKHSQIKEEVRVHSEFFRHDSVGGWPFSTQPHGWPITDCTAEGLKLMLYHRKNIDTRGADDVMLKKSCDLLLSFQNKDGGWASYELSRSPGWIELLNPSEIFGNIMIDYSYTECSSAAIQALLKFRQQFPEYRQQEVSSSIERGIKFILSQQREDGSWYGSWAVCFTYGTWFGTEALCAYLKNGLMKQGEEARKALQKTTNFILSKQNADGGWGESFESCLKKTYIATAESQVVNTAWALLSLLAIAGNASDANLKGPIQKAVLFIEKSQLPDGDFKQEHINGVFNHSCMISYTNYRNIFPLWALGRYRKTLNRFAE